SPDSAPGAAESRLGGAGVATALVFSAGPWRGPAMSQPSAETQARASTAADTAPLAGAGAAPVAAARAAADTAERCDSDELDNFFTAGLVAFFRATRAN